MPFASTRLRGNYPDLSVTDLNQVSIDYLTFDPGYQFSCQDAFGSLLFSQSPG
jgi:hypothetical protein